MGARSRGVSAAGRPDVPGDRGRGATHQEWWLPGIREGAEAGTIDLMGLAVLIADDNEQFLASSSALLEGDGLTVVGTARTLEGALALVRQRRPDAVLLDLNLGSGSGLVLAARITAEVVDPPVLILISSEAYDDVRDLLVGSPVRGFLSKLDLSGQAVESLVSS